MTFKTLYIIGNGFDQWHRIPSSYGEFKKFVHGRDRDVFDAVEEYIPAGEWWSDLEAALASLDASQVMEGNRHFLQSYSANDWSDSFHHDFQWAVEQEVSALSSGLKERFCEWVNELPIPTPSTAEQMLKPIGSDAVFLTFNYTPTLQQLYGIPDARVLHIHGSSESGGDPLILGHGWNPAERKSLNDRTDIEDEDTRVIQANDILDEYFTKTFKPTEQIINANQPFFDSLTRVDRVFVLGHSLSEVDRPYFQALLRSPQLAAAKWHVACRNETERHDKRDRLIEMGVSEGNAHSVLWDDLA